MQCRNQDRVGCRVFTLVACMVVLSTAAAASGPPPSPAAHAPLMTPQERQDLLFKLNYYASFYLADGNCAFLLDGLDGFQTVPFDYEVEKYALYYRARCNEQLGNFDAAYRQYRRLELLLLDDSDPLFETVQSNIKSVDTARRSLFRKLKRRARLLNRQNTDLTTALLKMGLGIGAFGLLTLLFTRWHREFQTAGGGLKLSDAGRPTIYRPEELIGLERMRRQDGRVAKADLDAWLQNPKVPERGSYLSILIHGHAMVETVNQCLPSPLCLILRPTWMRRLPYLWALALFSVVFFSVWTFLGFAIDTIYLGKAPPNLVMRLLLLAVVIGSLAGIRTMARRTVESLDELVTLMEKEETIYKICEWMRFLLRSPWQFFPAALLCAVYFGFKSSPSVNHLFVPLMIILVSPLIWMMLGGMIVTRSLSTVEDLGINPLSPLKTLGLQKWISVIGTFAVVGSIVLTSGFSLPFVSKFLSQSPYTFRDWVWSLIFIPFLIVFWIYPYFKLKGLIRRIKAQRMHRLKIVISAAFRDWTLLAENLTLRHAAVSDPSQADAEFRRQIDTFDRIKPQFEQMDTYYSIFKRIDDSPEWFFDINSVFELAKVMGIPSLFAILTYLLGV